MRQESAIPLRRLLAVIVPGMLLVITASDMVSLLLPLIAEHFAATEARVAWVVTGFLLLFSVGVPCYGRMSDRTSLRRLFISALGLYALGSLICAVASSLPMLVVGRVVTGAGGAAMPVLSIVAVTRLLPVAKRGLGVGFVSAAGGVGTAAGPAIGGGIGQLLGWRALFWVTVAAALLLVPFFRRVIPDERPAERRPFDIAGGVLLGAAIGLVLFGVTQAEGAGFGAVRSWGSLLAGGILGIGFVWRTVTARHPFVPPVLFADRGYLISAALIFAAMFVNLSTLVLVPLLVVNVDGLTPGEGAWVMIPGGVVLAILGPVAGRLIGRSGRVDESSGLIAAACLLAGSMFFLSAFGAGGAPGLSALGVLGVGAAFGLIATLVTSIAATTLPPEHAGVGMGIFQSAQFIGAASGPALLTALLATRSAAGAEAVNPFFGGQAAAYSDAFLVLAAVALVVVIGAVALVRTRASATVPVRPEVRPS